MALNAIDVGSLENFLLPAPISVAILGQLMAIASTIDFSLEKHAPTDGFKYVKQPGSFRACLVQISTSGCDAFTTADKNMDKIRLYCMQFQGHVQNLVRILKGSKEEKSTLAPVYLNDMMEKANKCLGLAQKTESDFSVLTSLLSEVSIAAIAAKGLHERNLEDAIIQTKILEKRKELFQLQKREIEEEKLQVIEQLSEAKNALDKIVDEIPSPMQTVGIATFEKTVSTLATGACIFRLSTLSAPVAISCVAAKDIVELGEKFFGKSSKGQSNMSEEDKKTAQKIALRNIPEIYALIRSLFENIESRLCHEVSKDGTKHKDDNQSQDDHQTKRNGEITMIYESFERYMKELDGSAFPSHEAVEVTRYLCKRCMSICVSLTRNKGCRKNTEDLLKEVKSCLGEAENLKIKSDQMFSAGSASCLNISVDSSNEDKGMVEQANENVHIKIETKKQNLDFMRRKQEVVKEKAQEINQQQCQLLEDLLKTDLQKINFEEIIQTLSKGMDALGRLDEQWHMMVVFFAHITNRIEVCISQDKHTFEKVLHGTGYTLTAGTQEIILETAAGINSIAYSVGLIAETYTDISVKHLVGASAGLIRMIALHPEKDADTLNDKRTELNKKCTKAQLEIKKLAAERREMALNHITEQFERLEILESELPAVEEGRKNKIRDDVTESMQYMSNMGKDDSDYF
ncbi:unnamed protein product [Mytilus coruscus]|uniref:Uncharacterized protein n=1 Tax=Mytilus coruscus TaxID=42192 RepID=A0A6J8A8N7_MYTCO|nr:unnamed protein product [Mytilus coruscus]